MQKKIILNSQLLGITLDRLCQQLLEKHSDFSDTHIIGLQPRGIHLAKLIHQKIEKISSRKVMLGYLDTTFYRDDFRRRDTPVQANETRLSFSIEGKKVLLVDDVLFTGRTVRAAMDALISFGRPSQVELLVLVDRRSSRDLPIAADYVGKYVNTIASQRVLVTLSHKQQNNKIWLINPI